MCKTRLLVCLILKQLCNSQHVQATFVHPFLWLLPLNALASWVPLFVVVTVLAIIFFISGYELPVLSYAEKHLCVVHTLPCCSLSQLFSFCVLPKPSPCSEFFSPPVVVFPSPCCHFCSPTATTVLFLMAN